MQMQREMGVSHVVFFRSLAQLPEGWVRQTRSNGATLAYADGTIDIMLDKECERSLGLFGFHIHPLRSVIQGYLIMTANNFRRGLT